MASLIATYNWPILNPNDQVYGSNCSVINDCPLQHIYFTPGIVYQTAVTNNKNDVEKIYHGLCEIAFKERFRNHTSSFRRKKNRNETKLSNYIYALKKEKKYLLLNEKYYALFVENLQAIIVDCA